MNRRNRWSDRWTDWPVRFWTNRTVQKNFFSSPWKRRRLDAFYIETKSFWHFNPSPPQTFIAPCHYHFFFTPSLWCRRPDDDVASISMMSPPSDDDATITPFRLQSCDVVDLTIMPLPSRYATAIRRWCHCHFLSAPILQRRLPDNDVDAIPTMRPLSLLFGSNPTTSPTRRWCRCHPDMSPRSNDDTIPTATTHNIESYHKQ